MDTRVRWRDQVEISLDVPVICRIPYCEL
jgi:capsular polysaccharide biosynthesis protein